MKKYLSIILFLLVAFTSVLYAQELFDEGESAANHLSADEFSNTIQMAMSSPDYLVTPGDVYSLTYAANGTAVSYTIAVDASYKVRVSNLAILDATGKSYIRLKKEVEEIVQKNFPMSGVQFVLMNPASFKVTVNGEVKSVTEKQASALTRLSSVVAGTTTPYSSIRDVTVTSANGKKRVYDIFKARRDGDLSQNPYLRPGDVITLNRINRVVNISGAVERPGNYELMKGENLKDLITYYGHGLTELADTTRIELVRSRNNMDVGGEKIYLSQKDIDSNFELLNRDSINIKNKSDLLPYITIEGIINKSDEATAEALDEGNVKDTIRSRTVKFYDGENYASLMRRYKGIFNSYSDLENVYIERGDSKYLLNIQEIFENVLYVSPYSAERGDKVIVPFIQRFVNILVNGEVNYVRKESAWPLRRLSTILDGNMTAYSSRRNVMVTGVDGTVSYYDLFKSTRDGNLEQDPYIHAGETITVQRMERKVTISGAVERPGTYEIVAGDTLKDLVEYYGHGLAELADTTRIELVRSRDNMDVGGEKIYLSQKDIDAGFDLLNRDSISIRSKSDLLPYIVVEGIINKSDAGTAEALEDLSPKDTMRRRTIKFYDGENYASLIRRYQSMFNSYSDLENAYVERGDTKIALNLEEILEDVLFVSAYNVERGDKLVVPFVQHFVNVLVKGEVKSVHEENAWPLRRLSAIIGDNLTEYSSTRDVIVTSVDGKDTVYDLFQAGRKGDLSQNPYIHAGETITVQRMTRKVTISGAVERPGTYELKEGENLKELIEYYGNGLEPMADTSRIEVTRLLFTENENHNESGEKLYWNKENIDNNEELVCYDSVHVSTYRDLRPVMFMEGAIKASETANLQASDKQAVRFEQGTNYAYLVRSYAGWFSSSAADTEHAYVIRGDKTIPVNLNQMLYDKGFYSDLTVEADDTLMVPFKQLFVSVAGAVYNPGRYPYIPDRTYEYYVGLAGGFTERNSGDAVTIKDANGKRIGKNKVVTPETTITAHMNSPRYIFNQWASPITTLLSIVISGLTLFKTFGLFGL